MRRIRFNRRSGALLGVVLLAGALVACGSATRLFQNVGSNLQGADAAYAPLPADTTSRTDATGGKPPGAGSSGDSGKADLATDQRRIVKTGEVTIEVESVANALARVRGMAVELGGYVGGAQAGSLDERATLTLRIPAERFDDALSRLHELDGKVLVESTREEDVTAAVVDLEARLKNLESSEAQYRALMARASKIEDILSIQSRLDDVQGQIEQLSAQLKQLSGQADLATLTVTLQPKSEPVQQASAGWDPGASAKAALGVLLQVGQAIVVGGIWLAIVGLPLLVVLAVILAVLLRLGLFRRQAPSVRSETPAA
jgi:hypothetical protein